MVLKLITFFLCFSYVWALCPDSWIEWEDYCYFFTTETDSFEYVYDICQRSGATLASLLSFEEQEFLSLHAEGNIVYIGLHDELESGNFLWTDGSPVNFTNWDTGFPVTQHKTCTIVDFSTGLNLWRNQDCNIQELGVCKISPGISGPPGGPSGQPECDESWEYFDGNCYYFSDSMVTWYEAYANCANMNANLTSILSLTENVFVLDRSLDYSWYCWLGLHGPWNVWTDGTEVEFENWGYRLPISNSSCAYGTVYSYSSHDYRGRWADANCNSPFWFTCKKPYEPDQTTTNYYEESNMRYSKQDNKVENQEVKLEELQKEVTELKMLLKKLD